jgi:hypothetical protein
MRPLGVTFGFLGAIPWAAHHFQSGRGRSSRFEATVRTSCSGIQSRALDAAARSCKRYRIRFDDGHTTILAAYELLTVSASARSTGQIVLGVAHTLLVCFAALPCRVLGGRRRGPAASVFASADREGRAACPKGQAQRNWCGHGPWAKATNGDHEVEERHAQVWRRFRVVLASLVQPGFRGAHGVHGVLKRPSSVWHFCSRALRAWAFHVRERRRLRKVRPTASHVRLEPHAVFRPSVYVRPCRFVADRAKVCQGAHSSRLVPSCPKLAGCSAHGAERFCGAGPRNTMATRICGAGEPDTVWI